MNTIKKIFRAIFVACVLFIIIGAFGSQINTVLLDNHLYSKWWFWLILVIAALFAVAWVMQDSPNSTSSSSKKGRNYGREYTDCNKAWQLIHKNGWNADDFTEAQKLLNDGHLRYTNNGDYIKELNKKIAQESLRAR